MVKWLKTPQNNFTSVELHDLSKNPVTLTRTCDWSACVWLEAYLHIAVFRGINIAEITLAITINNTYMVLVYSTLNSLTNFHPSRGFASLSLGPQGCEWMLFYLHGFDSM